ncbi:MAG: class I SAM-dependent methyltransferase [Candidatus Binataceae bacterium]
MSPQSIFARGGEAFDDLDVARCYAHRPPYPPELYDHLFSLTRGRRRALDLGCGTGKIARVLAEHFEEVDAVDPSGPMLSVALNAGTKRPIRWIEARAEDAELAGPYDLITAGASIHRMRHEILFPRLATHLANDGFIAVIEGDHPHSPPWIDAWKKFLTHWLKRLGRGDYDEPRFIEELRAFERWMRIDGRRTFIASCQQTIDDFLACQHSRSTFTRARMGAARANEFDDDLRRMLEPHANRGLLRFQVITNLTWGRPAAHS